METATDGRIICRNPFQVLNFDGKDDGWVNHPPESGIRFQVLHFDGNGDGWAYHPAESGIRFQVFNFDGNADGWAYHPPESGIRYQVFKFCLHYERRFAAGVNVL